MLIRIDRDAVARFAFRMSSGLDTDDVRTYYCAVAPWRLVLVCRHGLELELLAGQVVDARVGWDVG